MTWQPPENMPDLSTAKLIAIDTESYDPNLKEKGPGGVRKDGYLVGVSVAVDGWQGYFPIRHEGGGNLAAGPVIRWLQKTLSREDQPKVGANILYDVEMLSTIGVGVAGLWYDVQGAEALLDENRLSYGLDTLSMDYLGEGKDETLLTLAVAELLGKKPEKLKEADIKGNLWRLPADKVGPYAEQDASLALRIYQKQAPALEREGLGTVWQLETGLLPMLWSMRQIGVRVDLERAENLAKELRDREEAAQDQLDSMVRMSVNVWASESLAEAFDKRGLTYPKTDLGNPSFTKKWLESHTDPLAKAIIDVRRLNRLGNTFVKKAIMGHSVGGRIHCSFHSLRSDDSGTVSGRFSSSNPNLQQIPARDSELAPLVRGIFLPEEGCYWWSFDYSQIEPRVQVHYAYLQGCERADVARDRYITDSSTDYHQMMADLTGVDRRTAKDLNLGLSYGMGKKKLAASLGLPLEEAEKIFDQYHSQAPFVRAMSVEASNRADFRGYIKTLLGRRRRFNLWEPPWNVKPRPALPRAEAETVYEGEILRRAGTRKALNALVQGSAADIMKQAMLHLFKAKFRVQLTIHDEVCLSLPTGEEGRLKANEIKDIMQTCVELQVPLLVNAKSGRTWGEAE